MSQTLTLKVAGLYSNSNIFSEMPQGALAIADNIVISKDSIAESRRGFGRLFSLPSLSNRGDKLFQFQGQNLVHFGSTLSSYNGTTLNVFNGTYNHPDPLLARIKTAEANSNLYFTSSNGIQKLDALTNQPVQAGMFAGLDVTASPSTNSVGFQNPNTQVAYRVVWGITDANQNLVLGSPSQRTVVANSSAGQQQTSLSITIPSGVTTAHFFQVYRGNQSATSSTIPDDAMQLVYEANPTSAQITAKSITVIDNTPDSLRGAALYTNDTQQGILQANALPPFAYDIANFRGCLFFGNIKTKQQLTFSILSVGGTSGVQLGDVITLAGVAYTASASENAATGAFALVTTGTPAQNIDATALSLIRVINQNPANTGTYAYYLSSASTLPGQILIQERILGRAAYAMTASAHGAAYFPPMPTSGTSVSSTNQVALNGLMYSKQQIPDAVPSTNILYVGSAAKKILRILPLRDSLFVLKEDGVFYVSGQDPTTFSVQLLDNTAILLAPESAVTLNNKIYCLTTQGVVAISSTGVEIVSRPIEDKLLSLFSSSLSALQAYTFGTSYESERQYILSTVTTNGDTYATQSFVYNFITRSWTRYTKPLAHALVSTTDGTLYALDPSSSYVLQERKSGTFTDYSDESLPVNLNAFSGQTLTFSDISNISVGDAIYQNQSTVSLVTSINVLLNQVTVADVISNWTLGTLQVLKSIPCLIEWQPQYAQNPGITKQYREVTLLFKQNYFSSAFANFYSEVSPSNDVVPITGNSGASWGRFAWGGQPWGGVSRSFPYRMYVPLEKARCDLLSFQFQCQNTWARFQIEGLSMVLEGVSEKVSNQ